MALSTSDVQARLLQWSAWHAVAMLAGTALFLAFGSWWVPVCLAAASFAVLAGRCRGRWSPAGRFGVANGVTATRLVGILMLPAIAGAGHLAVAGGSLVLFALDGADGWLARRFGLESEFGEYFDKETDAFFLLILCLLLYSGGRLGGWILLAGLLRYGFVVFLILVKPPAVKERRSAKGKWFYFAMMSALIFAFTPFPSLYGPFAAAMTVLLVYSFVDAVRHLYGWPRVHSDG